MIETQRDVERLEALIFEHYPEARPTLERIPAGLGDRRFYRVLLEGRLDAATPSRMIARIEPESLGESAPQSIFAWIAEPGLEPIRTILENAGLPVPRSFVHEETLGIDLIEEAGSTTIADTQGDERRQRYFEASRIIAKMQSIEGTKEMAPAFGRIFDQNLIRTKAAKVIHWSFPGLLGRDASAEERAALESGFDAIADLLSGAPRRLAHRDYKAENLLLAPNPTSPSERPRLMLIDVQGAFMAPPEYDLVCLLRDLQVDLPEALVEEVCESIRARLPNGALRAEFQTRFEAIAVVRLAKDIAHIVHAAVTRGDRRRWHELPRGLVLLEASLDRLKGTFSPARDLDFVIHALTRGAETSDIEPSRRGS
jgi:aminoglycoside/choline kinase family phosphotransferase